MKSKTTLILSKEDIQEIVQQVGLDELMDKTISRLTESIRAYNPKQTVIPIRSGFNYNQPDTGLIEWMPLYKSGREVVLKLVGYHPNNPKNHDLPTIISTISSYDTSTGHLIGIMDGVLPTAIRTGAASAVASKILAKADSSVLGLIGCGAQAVTQLHALSRSFDFQTVLFYDIDQETQDSFIERCDVLNIDVGFQNSSMTEILNSADIVCTATSIETGKGPLFEDLPTLDHLHINAVGSDFPGKTELPHDFLVNSLVCPDFLDQALIEGECQQLKQDKIGPDIVELYQHPEKYITARDARTVFDSTGWALEDQVIMDIFLELANQRGLGKEIEIEIITKDAKNPYGFVKEATLEQIVKSL